MLAEGAGAAGVAALLQKKTRLNGDHAAVIVGGGNIDVSLLSRIIERGLVKDGRLVRIRIYLPDRPGALAELSAVIAGQRANIVELQFDLVDRLLGLACPQGQHKAPRPRQVPPDPLQRGAGEVFPCPAPPQFLEPRRGRRHVVAQ